MKDVKAVLVFEKDAPKTRAFGVRTKDGILIKVWVPKDMIKSRDTLVAMLALGGKKGKVRDEEDEDEGEEEDDEEEFAVEEDEDSDDDDADEEDEDEEEDEPAPKKKPTSKKRR